MANSPDQAVEQQGAIDDVLADYLQRVDEGEAVDRDQFIAAHPDVADALRSYFSGADEIDRVAGPTVEETMVAAGRENDTAVASESHPATGGTDGAIPREFGRYRVVRTLGTGAMGAVYLADDTQLDRQVALKVPKFAKKERSELLLRFNREAKAAATLSHPNVCPVFDVGEIDGTHFISMGYVEGRPLNELIDPQRSLSEVQVASVIRKLALAMAEAHQKGVVHRDIKPANIMIDKRREPIIMDFGLARSLAVTDEERVTHDGAIVGTPAYMPPEQIKGDIDQIGPAADIYSLGVVMYEMLTGRLPYSGSVTEVIARVLHDPPPSPAELRPDIDSRLDTICQKAMSKAMSDRYASMNDLASELAKYLHKPYDKPPKTASSTQQTGKTNMAATPQQTTSNTSQKPSAGEFDPYHKWLGIPPREQPPNHYRLLAIDLFESDPDAIQAAAIARSTYVRQCASGPHAALSQDVLNHLSEAEICLLNPEKKAAYDAQLKAELDAKEAAKPQAAGGATETVSTGKKAKPAADSKLQQQIQKLDKQKKQIESLLEKCEFASAIAALEKMAAVKSPKLAKYAKWAKQQIPKAKRGTKEMRESSAAVYRTASGLFDRHDYEEAAEMLQQIPAKYRDAEFKELLQECLDLQEEITVLQEDIDHAESLNKYKDLQPTVERLLELKPADRRARRLLKELKTYGKGGSMRLGGRGDGRFDAAGNTSSPLKVALGILIPVVLFGAVGYATVVYVRSNNKTIKIEIDDPTAKVVIDGETVKITGVGDEITLKVGMHDLVVERDGLVVRTDQFEVVKGKNPVLRISLEENSVPPPTNSITAQTISQATITLKGHTNSVYGAVFSSDGKRIVSASRGDNAIMLWDAVTGQRIRTLSGHTGHVTGVAFSPDGSRIISGSEDKTIKLWNVATGEELQTLSGHEGGVTTVAISRDGTRIVSGGRDETIRIWDTGTGETIQSMTGHQPTVLSVDFSNDNKLIVSGGRDNIVRLWDASTGNQIREFKGHTNNVVSVAFSTDGTRIVSGCSTEKNDKVKIWNAASGEEIHSIGGHVGHVRSVAVSPNGRWVASGSNDKTVKLWEMATGQEVLTLKEHEFEVLCVSFSPGNNWIVSGSNNGTIKTWDISRIGSATPSSGPAPDDSTSVFLTDLKATEIAVAFDFLPTKFPVTVNGVTSPHGFHMHPTGSNPQSKVSYALSGRYARFTGGFGILDRIAAEMTGAPITVTIIGDGKELYASPPLQKRGSLVNFDVDVSSINNLLITAKSKSTSHAHIACLEPRLISVSGGSGARPVSAPGLVAYYPLNETLGTTIKDASGNGHDGTIQGTTESTSGKFGGAMSFGKDALIDLGKPFDLSRTKPFSIGAWILPNEAGKMTIVRRHPPAGGIPGFALLLDDGGLLYGRLSHIWGKNAIQVATTRTLTANSWQHVMMTYDGSSKAAGVKLYIDGQPQPVKAIQDTLTQSIATTSPMVIGQNKSNPPYAIDEVGIYNRVLSAAEVQKSMSPLTVTASLPSGPQSKDFVEVRLTGRIDGLDEVRISKGGADWNHRESAWPTELRLNGKQWTPQNNKVYPNSGASKFLPDNVRFEDATVKIHQGRGGFYFEKFADHVYLGFKDSPAGGGIYDVTFRMPVGSASLKASAGSGVAAIRVNGTIDGNQELRLFTDNANWNSRELAAPQQISINGKNWNPQQSKTHANSGVTQFMPNTVKFQQATLTITEGRGPIFFQKLADHVYVNFNDNKPGADVYDVTVEMPSGQPAATSPGPATGIANVEITPAVKFKKLEVGATISLGQRKFTWTEIPKGLQGGSFSAQAPYSGITRFKVTKNGPVFVAFTKGWGGGGGGGPWQKEVISRQQLEAQGWKEVAQLKLHSKEVWIVFSRDCKAGEEFAMRNHKYSAPFVIVPPAGADTSDATNRKAAEWVLSVGGVVGIEKVGLVSKLESLPQTSVVIESVRLGNRAVSDDDLKQLQQLNRMNALILDGTDVADNGFKHLVSLPELKFLFIRKTKTTDDGVATIAKIRGLEQLYADETLITDDGVEHLKNHPTLIYISLAKTRVGDKGIAHLKTCRKLITVDLSNLQLTDAGLMQLADLKNLSRLQLHDTAVTDAGIAKFHAARKAASLPAVEVLTVSATAKSSSPTTTPSSATNRQIAERILGLGGSLVTDSGAINAVDELSKQPFEIRQVVLSNTQITNAGLVDLQGLLSLTVLRLENTSIGDAGLVHLKGLTNLETLLLTGTQVTDAGLVQLQGMTKLDNLLLGNTLLTADGLKHLAALESLATLRLTNTKVDDASLVLLKGLTNLTSLSLDDTSVGDAGLTHLKELTNLETLVLSGTQVTDAGLANLEGMTTLRQLYLNNTPVTGDGLKHVAGLNSLASLRLTNTQVDDSGLIHVKGLTNLTNIYLDKTPVSDAGLEQLKGLTNLDIIVLTGTQVTDAGLVHLQGMTRLAHLYLGNTAVTGNGLKQLEELTTLLSLRLTNTQVDDSGLAHLHKMKKLTDLWVDGTKVTENGVADLQQTLPNCKVTR